MHLALYAKLSAKDKGKNPVAREALLNLSRTEQKHLTFWSRFCQRRDIKPNETVITFIRSFEAYSGRHLR